jgi:carbamoyl-phosphate synthase large subunit
MNNYNEKTVLLTGAGGPAPAGMISVMRKWGYRIIAVDMAEHSPAFYLADKAYVIPAGNSPEFLPALKRICKKENVNAVVSVVDEELPHVSELEKEGIKVLQPEIGFTNLCLDKYKCMNKLREVGINAPKTWLVDEIPTDAQYPIFAKPTVGRGSRGIGVINSKDDLKVFIENSTYDAKDLIFQPYLAGTEYTVSVVVWRDGKVHAVVPKEIISKVGVTKMAVTRKDDKIYKLCCDIQDKLKANGPFNVQLRFDDLGEPIPFEINPRFSTSITLTMASGIDELGGLLSKALFGDDSFQFDTFKDGVVLLRHTEDQFISEDEYKTQTIEKS